MAERKIKKNIKILLSTVLLLALTLTVPSISFGGEVPDYIKVGLKYGSTAMDSVTITASGGFITGTTADSGFSENMPLPAYSTVIATVENNVIQLKDETGTLLASDLGSSGCLMPSDYGKNGKLTLNGKEYRGGFILLPSNGKVKVINYVPVDQYLYGVIHSEMSSSYPIEALKAQSVAARSYVVMNLNRHKGDGFDVCDSIHCQVYGGCKSEYPSTTRAVDETNGEVLYYDGKPVSSYYSKNSGGYTLNSEDVWNSKVDYLRAVKDIYSPTFPWVASFTKSTLQAQLASVGKDPGTIESVSIKSRNESGGVAVLEVKGSNGTITLQKDGIRTALGGTQVKSLMFDIGSDGSSIGTSNGGSGSSGTAGTGGTVISGATSSKGAEASFYALGTDGKAAKVNTADTYAAGSTAKGKLSAGKDAAVSGSLTTITSNTIVFSGKGYGHGVGMPQDSAIEMAKQGFQYQEILKFYFTGVEIR